jgi:phosphohistidine phosphatase
MELYVLRHAIAVERGAPEIRRDSERPLSSAGRKRMQRIARGMRALKMRPELILSSPYLRARQTAELVAREFEAESILELSPLLEPGGDPEELMSLLGGEYGSIGSVVLVGHEPSLSELISMLLSGDERMAVTMKKGGLCKLTLENPRYGRCATLEWLLTPRQLTRLADSNQ